jgi:hypothetical protein
MRRICVSIAVAALLAVPAGALALATDTSDGTLLVKNGDGKVSINATGALIGALDKGTVKLVDPAEQNTGDLILKGCDNNTKTFTDNTITCSGKDLRYRVVEGRFKVRINGSGVDLSAVGVGFGDTPITLNGDPSLDVDNDGFGTYKLNDDKAKAIPDKPTILQLGG